MNVGAPELLILVLVALFGVLPLWGIIDAAIRPDAAWAAAGQNKVVWVLVQIFLGVLGAIAYFVAIRPKLKAVT